ncbi:MAG: cation:proton antiporter [Thermoprotei archaeon]|nr:MAG: cation:proton antiporter [Thermoprotei archaeon]
MGSTTLSKLGKIIVLTAFFFLIYVIASASITLLDVVVGLAASSVVAVLVAEILVKSPPSKLIDLRRWGWYILYALHYFTVIEWRAHIDVIRRILHPKMPINPGIVRVPYHVVTDYATVLIANSITNTPGTVVVEVDESRKYYYVHWIDVISTKEEICYEKISKTFEKYAKRIFD